MQPVCQITTNLKHNAKLRPDWVSDWTLPSPYPSLVYYSSVGRDQNLSNLMDVLVEIFLFC